MIRNVKHYASAALVLCAFLYAGSCLAAKDTKRWPGAICQPVSGANAKDFNYGADGIFNNSNVSLAVVCPITRDSEEDPYIGGDARLIVRGLRTAGASVVSCTLVLGDDFNGPPVSVVRVTPLETDFWALLWQGAFFPAGSSNMAVTVVCQLPPKTKLGHIFWREDKKTDLVP